MLQLPTAYQYVHSDTVKNHLLCNEVQSVHCVLHGSVVMEVFEERHSVRARIDVSRFSSFGAELRSCSSFKYSIKILPNFDLLG